jgi:hypothetical protein
MKKLTTTIFSALIALALSIPAMAQTTAPTQTPAQKTTPSTDSGKKSTSTKKSNKKKTPKKAGDTSSDKTAAPKK